MDLSLPLIRVSCDLEYPCLPGTEKNTQREISFECVNSPYKRVTSLFSELCLCRSFLKITSSKVILMPRRRILEWHS